MNNMPTPRTGHALDAGALLDHTPDVVARFGPDLRYLYVNAAVEGLTGLAPTRFIGRTHEQLGMPAALVDGWNEALEGVFRTGGPTEISFYQDGPRGRRWLQVRLVAEQGTDGRVATVLGVCRDLTEVRHLEDALRMYQKAVDNMQLGVTLTDQHGAILFTNPAEARMHGYEPRELVGRHARLFAPRSLWNVADEAPTARQRATGRWQRESVNVRRDGSEFPVALWSDLVTDSTGEVLGLLTVAEDLSEKQQARDALRQSEEQYRQLVEHANDLVYRTDAEGRFTFVNPACMRVMGYPEAELVGRLFTDLVHPDECERVLAFYRKQFARGTPTTYLEFRALGAQGREVWIGQHVQLLRRDSRTVGYQAQARDITQRRRAEDSAIRTAVRMRTVAETAAQLLSAHSLDDLQRLLRAACARVLRFDAFTVATLDAAAATLFFVGQYDGDVQEQPARLALAGTPDERVVRERHPLVVHTSADPAGWGAHRLGREQRSESSVRVPILADGRVLGVISVQSYTPHAFDHGDVEVLQTIAALAATTLENIRRADERDAAERALHAGEEAVRELHRIASEPRTPWQHKLHRLLDLGRERFGLETGLLARVQGDRFTILASRTPDAGLAPDRVLPLSEVYCGQTVQQPEPLAIEHAGKTGWRHHACYAGTGLEAYLGARVVVRGELFGTLCFLSEQPHPRPFSAGERDFLRLMTDWVGGELARREAEQKLQQAHDELEQRVEERTCALHEAVQALQQEASERQRAEVRLRASEERYRGLFEQSTDAIFMATPGGRVLDANRAFLELTGRSRADAVAVSSIEDYLDADACALLRARLRRNDALQDLDTTLRRADGTSRDVLVSMTTLRDEAGGVLQYQGTVRDVTQRNRIERALRESEERYRNVVQSLSEGITITDPDDVVLYSNDRMAELTGIAGDEMLGRRIHELLLPASEWSAARERLRERQYGTAASYEVHLRRPDGRSRWLQVFASPYRNSAGRVIGTVGANVDITDRKAAEAAVRRERDFAVQVMNTVGQGLTVVDLEGTFQFVNPAFAELVGYPAEDLLGKTVFNVVPPEVRGALQARYDERAQGVSETYETWLRRADGNDVYVLITAAPRWQDGQVIGAISVVSDLTERKLMEEALRQREQDYRNLFENAHDAILIMRPEDETVLDANPRACQLYGYSRTELIGMSMEAVSVNVERGRQHVQETLQGSTRTDFLLRQRRRDGAELFVEIAAATLTYSGLPAILSINRDVTDRVQAETARRESEERFRAVFANSAVGIGLVDMDRRWQEVNPALERMLGHSAERLRGRFTRNIVGPDERDRDLHLFHELVAGERSSYQIERRYLHEDGREVWTLMTASLVRRPGGQPWYVIAIFEDVTERAQAAARLVARERQLSDAQALAHLGSFMVNLHSGETEWSDELFRIFGQAPQSFRPSPQRYLDHVHPADRARVHAAMQPAGPSAERLSDLEHRVVQRDGAVRVVNTRRELLGTPGAPDFRVSGTVLDLTEVRRAEDARQESEAQFRAMFETAATGIAVVDVAGRPVEANPALRRMFGYSDAELRQLTLNQLAEPEDAAADAHLFADLLDGTRDNFRVEKRYRSAAGALIWGRLTLSAVRDEHHALQYAIAMVEDVTEQRVAQEALQESIEQLRQSQKMEAVGRLAGGVAHDFNNLLMAIMGHLYILQRDPDLSELRRHNVDEIRGAAERAATLTQQLLAFSRRQVLAPRPVDLNGIVHDMQRLLNRLVGETVVIVAEQEPALGQVTADPGQMEQVLMNLVVNARDAMSQGGRIDIRTANTTWEVDDDARPSYVAPGPYVHLQVADTGHGMDAETRARAFDPFFTTKEFGKGTGLGLATVYGIVKQSGGYILLHTAPGQGATFDVYLPRTDAESVESAQPTGADAPHGGETVLLAEDEIAVRRPIAAVLRAQGYTVLEGADGLQAMKCAEEHEGVIHLLLTDVVMPVLGGRDLALRLTDARPGLRVLYMSGYPGDDISFSLRTGERFLQKPMRLKVLVQTIRELLDEPL